MRFLIVSLGFVIVMAYSLSAATLVRYRDNVFTNVGVTSNILYGSNVNADGTTQTLLLDVYQPTGDTAKARPLVIFMFGGGWAVGTKTDGDQVLLSQTFAKKGYVTASIQYRLDTSLMNTKPLIPMTIAMYRGMQDAKAAVRFLRAHKATYKIDDTRILMGGCSAGAFNSLLVAFLDSKEIPSFIDTTKVGGLEGNSGTPGVSSAINGVINNWGAVEDSTWLYNNKIPVISFAGTADPQVPFDHNATFCGSACIDRVLTRLGVYSVLKPFPGMGHGMAANDPRYDTLLTMAGQFAYDVLFANVTSAAHFAEGANRPARQTTPGSIAFCPTFYDRNVPLFRSGTIYTLNGCVVDARRAQEGLQKRMPGIYVFQPVAK
jgi:poly(3-hydroxybutyrate) depolymerase